MKNKKEILDQVLKMAESTANEKTWILAEYSDGESRIRGHGSAPSLFSLSCEIVKQMALKNEKLGALEYIDLLTGLVKQEIAQEEAERIGKGELS